MTVRKCLCIGAFLSFAAAVFAGEEGEPPYPLEVGNCWTFRIRGQPDKLVQKAVRREKVGEQTCVVLELSFNRAIATEHVAVLKDGVYRFKYQNRECSPPVRFLKLPARKGDKWKSETKIGEESGSTDWEADVAEVTVPAGAYKGALVVTGTMTTGKKTVKTTFWYVPGVGMVKQVHARDGEEFVVELEKFEKAAAKKNEKK